MSQSRIWLLTGAKHGDNAQTERLIEASGLAFERRRIVLKPGYDLAKPRLHASLHHVDLEKSDALAPPWPDLVLTIGRRLAMVALWIKEQSQDRTKLALIGTPKGDSGKIDLFIVPFQYRAAEAPNIFRIGLPLLGIDPARVATEGERWRATFAELPRPLTVLLCGGSIGSHSFDPETARGVLATIDRMKEGGSLQVTTSRRTPPETVAAIEKALPAGAALYRWDKAGADNPYIGLLAHGDRFVVTGDSVSMLVEVARLGKPLAIAPLRLANRTISQALRRLRLSDDLAYGAAAQAQRLGERVLGDRTSRDFTLLHDLMYRQGWAVPLGSPFVKPKEPPADDTVLAAQRLRALLAQSL
ncbi:MAG TPA: ELM1/GtrOC1 family putative glycosyltransferase [Nordella sp.]|nr:ELM1/GtrOC1 family putative glycosyltransferase [Nordella sp.]